MGYLKKLNKADIGGGQIFCLECNARGKHDILVQEKKQNRYIKIKKSRCAAHKAQNLNFRI